MPIVEGSSAVLTALIEDIDDSGVTVVVNWGYDSAPETIAASTGGFTATHFYTDDSGAGSFPVALQVVDAAGAMVSASTSVRVHNSPPAGIRLSPSTGAFAQSYSGQLAGDDVPSDPLTWSLLNAPAWVSVSTSGVVTGIPGASDSGTASLFVQASDDDGGIARSTVSIEVEGPSDSRPPRTTLAIGAPRFGSEPVFVASATVLAFQSTDDLSLSDDGLGLGVATLTLTINGTTTTAVNQSTSASFAYILPAGDAPEGHLVIGFAAVDRSENFETTQTTSVVLDRSSPITELARSTPSFGEFVSTWTVFSFFAVDRGSIPVGLDVTLSAIDGAALSSAPAALTLALPERAATVSYLSRDRLGNEEILRSTHVVIDAMPPSSTLTVAGPQVFREGVTWLSPFSSVTLSAVDPDGGSGASGVSRSMLSLDGSSLAIAVGFIDISTWTEGLHPTAFFSRDRVDNVEPLQQTTLGLDASPPLVIITSPAAGARYLTGGPAVEVVFSTADAFDPEPAVAARLRQLEDRGTPRGTRPGEIAVARWQQIAPADLDDGIWELQVSATDFVQNAAFARSGAFEVIHDALPPVTALTAGEPRFEPAGGGAVFITSRTALTLTSRDDLAEIGDGAGLGVASQEVLLGTTPFARFDNLQLSSGTPFVSSFTLQRPDGTAATQFRASDVLGNAETFVSRDFVLDGTPPSLSGVFGSVPLDAGAGVGSVTAPSTVTAEGRGLTVLGTAADRLGNSISVSTSLNIDRTPPLVDAGSPATITEGSSTTLTAVVSDNLDATPSFTWQLSDGQMATGTPNVARYYAQQGGFDESLTATDHAGHASSDTVRVTVLNAAPEVAAGGNRSAIEGQMLNVTAAFTDRGPLDRHSATIDWGDTSSTPMSIEEAGGNGTAQAQYTYRDDGTFAVTVTVADEDGGVGIATFTVTVANSAPALAGLPDVSIDEGDLFTLLRATFTDAGADDVHAAIVNWGDGSNETAAISSRTVLAQHAYGEDGTYLVAVTVTDNDGATSSRTFTATVANVAPSLAELTDQAAAEGSTIGLEAATFSDPGFFDSHTATVNWGDGTLEAAIISSRTLLAQHSYGDNGAYTVTVTVTDNDGGASSQSFMATIANVAPALAALTDQSASEGALVRLEGAAFTDPGLLDTHTATVDWGDGTSAAASISSKVLQAQHNYGDDGQFTVIVTVTDDDGGVSSRTFKADVANVSPALAALADQSALEGSPVSLQGATFTDPGFLDAHTATVDWGDGVAEAAAISS
ncbi:MAG: PDK repeat-containing protein, partial [bacterium]